MKNQIVICDTVWPFAQGTPLVKGEKYRVLKSYWYNGEGWFTVERVSDCAPSTAPDVFFDDVR